MRAVGYPLSAAAIALGVLAAAASSSAQTTRTLDDFETVAAWSAHPSDNVSLHIASDTGRHGRAMRLDFDFHGGGGYAIARRTLGIDLPSNYQFSFSLRGDAPTENLEFKLVDASGDNVWWQNRRDVAFPTGWQTVTIRKRHISFAWGPKGGGELDRVAALEISITAGSGGKGTIWLDDLRLTELPPDRPYAGAPVARASSSAPGSAPRLAIDGDPATAWRSAPSSVSPTLDIDFGTARESGGLVLDWAAREFPAAWTIETSMDGARWDTAYAVPRAHGGRAYVPLPEHESRWVRVRVDRASATRGVALGELRVMPLEWAATPNDLFRAIARDAPRGDYPRYWSDQQVYWTVVGVDADPHEALFNEDGALETGKGSFSIEPLVSIGGRLIAWSDARRAASLVDGVAPAVAWRAGDLSLAITAWATGEPGRSSAMASYRVTNQGARAMRGTLYLAIRPFQVNPPWQFLGAPGGAARVRELAWDGEAVRADGGRAVFPLVRPDAFGAMAFDEGSLVERLRRDSLPHDERVVDERGWASGALAYRLELAPGASREVMLEIPLEVPLAPSVARSRFAGADPRRVALAADDLRRTNAAWNALAAHARIVVPAAPEIPATIASTLRYIMINRDGPAIQPGSRSYERSWIRDGSLTSAALLRLGHADVVKRFIEWYAPYQFANGKVPCCVDARGADPVPENDSHGELIFVIAEYWRFTHDTALVRREWPHVERAAAYIDSLRRSRMTSEYASGAKRAFYGLVPQSISHEGYSAKPMHSYWDDAFAYRGLADAAALARVLGLRDDEARWAAARDEMRRDIVASYRLAMAEHRIDYLPGSVELGDFDATSTTVSVSPGGLMSALPDGALRNTFERYWRESSERARRWSRAITPGDTLYPAYTPYEWRTVGTMIRLGWVERAHAMIDFFMSSRRPAAWRQWGEVVWRDPLSPKFVGDIPHTWVGSDFIRSALDLFAYERERDSSLVIGAGVKASWLDHREGVSVDGLRTEYGALTWRMTRDGGAVRVAIEPGLVIPRGGIVVRAPVGFAARRAIVDGASAALSSEGDVTVRRLPAVVRFEP
jgi:hypothetical protein